MTYGINNIQGVAIKTVGPLAAFFKYGDAEIKIIGQADSVVFKQIPNAQIVQDKILQAHQDYLKNVSTANKI